MITVNIRKQSTRKKSNSPKIRWKYHDGNIKDNENIMLKNINLEKSSERKNHMLKKTILKTSNWKYQLKKSLLKKSIWKYHEFKISYSINIRIENITFQKYQNWKYHIRKISELKKSFWKYHVYENIKLKKYQLDKNHFQKYQTPKISI